MDYEKKYSEALERARKAYNAIPPESRGARKIIEDIFPELRESERIRKVIYILLLGMRSEIFTSQDEIVTKEKALAWLEKQKEHRETCTKFLAKILKHSAEGFRNVLKKKGIDYIPHESFWTGTAETFSKQECNEFYKWMDDMTMELVTEETPEYKKGFKDGLDASKKEQKPAEWSEEDRLHYANVLEALEYVKGCKSDYDKIEAVKSDITWLKSLRPSWKPSEEQMEALATYVNGPSFLGTTEHLESLYQDLKKLM